jgi:arginine decarboxylase
VPGANTPEGDIRKAYFLAYDEKACEYISLNDGAFEDALKRGEQLRPIRQDFQYWCRDRS